LALIIGNFNQKLTDVQVAEIIVNDIKYNAEMRAFDVVNDMFPPFTRSGGMKSKVARKIADSYLTAKQWDEQNFKVAFKTKQLAQQASQKWREVDEKYKVQEKASTITKQTMDTVRDFDEQHQISKRIVDTAKNVDEKYNISKTFQSAVDKIQAHPTFQNFSQKN